MNKIAKDQYNSIISQQSICINIESKLHEFKC